MYIYTTHRFLVSDFDPGRSIPEYRVIISTTINCGLSPGRPSKSVPDKATGAGVFTGCFHSASRSWLSGAFRSEFQCVNTCASGSGLTGALGGAAT